MQYGDFANVYDKLMSDVDYDGWSDYVLSFMPKSASVIECACGTGEITRRLAAAGHEVLACDISPDMIRVASEKLRLCGAVSKRVHFAVMDMRKLAAHRSVDCVVCCCDGVNYLTSREDVKLFLSSAFGVLKPGGLLLFDVSSRYKLSTVLGQNCFVNNDPQYPYLWQNTYDEENKLLRMELAFFIKKGSLYERFDETHIQRAHSQREIENWLSDLGFEYKAYDSFSMEAPNDHSERIQFAARKPI